jgi:hypothetical protein
MTTNPEGEGQYDSTVDTSVLNVQYSKLKLGYGQYMEGE